MKADSMADALHLSPFRITTNDENIEYSFYTLVNKSTMQTLSQLGVLDKPFLSQIKTHAEEPTKENVPEIAADKLNLENFPSFESIMGPYCPITKEIEHDLNEDCNLMKIANLFTKSLLCMEQMAMEAITVEVYDRDFTLDVHAENPSKGFPEMLDRNSRYYELIKVIIKEEKQGKQLIKKPIIGTTKFNILITCSLLLSPVNSHFVTTGPSCHELLHYLNPSFTQILFRESSIKAFYEEQTVPRPEVTGCRQLMSAFDHKSTYFTYRSSILANPIMMPASVFTVCNVPSNGYVMSADNNACFVSIFFQNNWQMDN